MIDLAPEYYQVIKNILREKIPRVEVWIFGSRIDGKAQKYSDIDLVLVGKEKFDWRLLEQLKDAFSESDLPMIVDIIDWNAISPEFREIIKKKYEVIQSNEVGIETILTPNA
jgi:predicted nucleotidyltransferase